MARSSDSEYRKTIEAKRLAESISQGHAFAIGRKDLGLTSEIATDRLAQWLQFLPDPDLTLKAAGLSRAQLRRLEKDDEVTQCWEKRLESVIGVPWRLEPNQTRNSKWLTQELTPHMDGLIRGALEARLYGYSVQEVTYRPGSRVGIQRIGSKPFEWFFFNPTGELRYRPNDGSDGVEGIPCDPRKFLLTTNRATYANPYGEALISRLWWPVYYRAQLWAFRLQALERYGMPLTVGKTMGDRAEFASQLSQLAANAVVAIGDQDSVTFAEAAQTGEAFSKAEQELVARIQKLILGQTLTSQMGDTGSYAAAQVHYQVQTDKRNADIDLVTGTVQRLIDTLCELNGIDPPRFVMADDTGLEMARAQRDALLVEKGIVKLTKEYLMDRYDFVEGDFEIEEKQPVPPALQPTGADPEAPEEDDEAEETNAEMAAHLITLRKRKTQFTPQQQAIENAADALLAKVPEPIPLSAMLQAVKAAQDPADLAVRLSLLLDQQDPRFTELLARAQFAATTLGYVVAEQAAPTKEEPKPQAISLSITAPITMAAPEPQTVNVQLEAQPVQVTVNVPEQPAPVVNVAAPAVTVDVQPAPVVMAHPARAVQTVERDPETLEVTKTITTYEET